MRALSAHRPSVYLLALWVIDEQAYVLSTNAIAMGLVWRPDEPRSIASAAPQQENAQQ
jgi:hypothetical protein